MDSPKRSGNGIKPGTRLHARRPPERPQKRFLILHRKGPCWNVENSPHQTQALSRQDHTTHITCGAPVDSHSTSFEISHGIRGTRTPPSPNPTRRPVWRFLGERNRKNTHTGPVPVAVSVLWTTQPAAGSDCSSPWSRSTSDRRRSSARARLSTVRIACITVAWSRPPRYPPISSRLCRV